MARLVRDGEGVWSGIREVLIKWLSLFYREFNRRGGWIVVRLVREPTLQGRFKLPATV